LREEFDTAVAALLAQHSVDVAVNAGYMLIAPVLCRRYTMLNLHPALPSGPKGTWQQVMWQLIASGARETGAMVHLVTEEVDEGPALSFCRFGIGGREFAPLWDDVAGRSVEDLRKSPGEDLPLFAAIRRAGLVRERPLLVESLRAVADGRISADQPPVSAAVDLTEQVEQAVAAGGG
jgi:hypothetical protein